MFSLFQAKPQLQIFEEISLQPDYGGTGLKLSITLYFRLGGDE
jgi:hypothetical protein